MTKIEKLAKSYIETSDSREQLGYQNEILSEITKDTWQFRSVTHAYLVGKVLFNILSYRHFKDNGLQDRVLKLALYCLFKLILEIRNQYKKEERSSEYAQASAMLLILLDENRYCISEKCLMPYLNNDPNQAVRQMYGLILVCYWNYKLSSVTSILDDDVNIRLETSISNYPQINNKIEPKALKSLEDHVFYNIDALVKIFESSFDIYEDDFSYLDTLD